MITAQEIFDKAYNGILDQGAPGILAEGLGCVYEHPTSGRRCGIGHVLSDREINHINSNGLGQQSIANIPSVLLEDHPELVEGCGDLATEIQDAHDGAAETSTTDEMFINTFKYRMQKLADGFGLKVPVRQA